MARKPDEVELLRTRLSEAEETLDAIRNGEVDALVVGGAEGDQIYTLRGADHHVFRHQGIRLHQRL